MSFHSFVVRHVVQMRQAAVLSAAISTVWMTTTTSTTSDTTWQNNVLLDPDKRSIQDSDMEHSSVQRLAQSFVANLVTQQPKTTHCSAAHESSPLVLNPGVVVSEQQPHHHQQQQQPHQQHNHHHCAHGSTTGFSVRRRATLARMNKVTTRGDVEAKYEINPEPIGEGAFGQVFVAKDRQTGELVAVKKIWKEHSDSHDFVREMGALLQIRSEGGHPHICQLRENFEELNNYALVLDLVKGGEMFDHLVENGAYSELDASRLIREVASALTFLHGIGLVHCDLKPENLMLSSKSDSEASIKLVDFGCSELLPGFGSSASFGTASSNSGLFVRNSGGTIAYSPPECFADKPTKIADTLDMWSLGIILHIMLTGVHPLDEQGDASDEYLTERLRTLKKPPLKKEFTEHLSPSAIDLLSKLLEPDPSKRLRAHEMLEHSWVRGETARSAVIAGSDEKLAKVRKFRSKIERKVFQQLMHWSDKRKRKESSQQSESLVEMAFKSLSNEENGFLTRDENSTEADDDENNVMTLSAFSDLLGENMQNKYFPAGHVIFSEGDRGEYMYFLNSGTCEVSTKSGFQHTLEHGDTFGEGGLITENGTRSATIKTKTPVHAIQIDRECFQKYLLGSDSALALMIKEKVNKRRFGRAEFIIGNQNDLEIRHFAKDDRIYSRGDKPDAMYYVADGTVAIRSDGHTVYHANPGMLHGVQAFFMNRPREAEAVCVSNGCSLRVMSAEKFAKLDKEIPELRRSLVELALRREFQRAIVRKLNSSFSTMNLRDIFDSIDMDKSGKLNCEEIRCLLQHLKVTVSDDELKMMLETLDLDKTGVVNFEEFTTLFA